MSCGEQFIDKIEKPVLIILQKHLDTWKRKHPNTIFLGMNPQFQDINQFILYWYKNPISAKKLSTIPGLVQGNMAYILKVLNHYSYLA